jgi:hypothetical protein
MNNAIQLVAALVAAVSATAAGADEHRLSTPMLPAYAQECASCHVAYPPALLPASSWQRLMGNLPRHFGSDASLDAPLQAAITTWLTAHAGRGRRAEVAPPEDRITRSAWFVREHREVGAAVWQRPAVRSASNCSACHRDAAQGGFDEDAVVIPR